MLARYLLLLALVAAAPAAGLDWAFPGSGPKPPALPGTQVYHLPGASRSFTEADLRDQTRALDWFPDEHPPAPRAVLAGEGKAWACGYCHLVSGAGRSENAQLRGQPASYIEEQVRAFAAGARRPVDPGYAPSNLMAAAARAISPADLHAAAVYFAALEPQRHAQVIEAATIPHAEPEGFLYRFDNGARERLGNRIVEGATDAERHRMHDPHEQSLAYVPEGAIARGALLANHGTAQFAPCASCHTANFVGIGGESPTYIVRQLAGFRAGTRNDPGAAPMQAVAARLTDAQILDLAAYVGSREPWTRAQMASSMLLQP
jgi:cytochrome c553